MKSASPLVVGNWKMNPQTEASAKKLFKDVCAKTKRTRQAHVVVAAPFVFIASLAAITNKRVRLAAQDVHAEKLGAFTGEVSLPMLTDVGVSYVILGHSERRAMGETDESVNKKLAAALKAHMTAIVCVGERARDSHAQYFTLVEKQIRKTCAGIPRARLDRVVIAYEPIWAIGTGNTATPQDAHEMKLFIQKILTDVYGRSSASRIRILYGGSVNAKNAEILLTEGNVDGFLVGGASLRGDEFGEIVNIADSHVTK